MADIINGISLGLSALGVVPSVVLIDDLIEKAKGSLHEETVEDLKSQMQLSIRKFEAFKETVDKHKAYQQSPESGGETFLSNYADICTTIIQRFSTLWMRAMRNIEVGNGKRNTEELQMLLQRLVEWGNNVTYFQTLLLKDLPNDLLARSGHSGNIRKIKERALHFKAKGSVKLEGGMVTSKPLKDARNIVASKATYFLTDEYVDISLRRTDVESLEHCEKMAVVARALELADPETMGLPRWVGIARLKEPKGAYDMIFRVERKTDSAGNLKTITPRSLRELLSCKPEHLVDLTSRVQLAVQLARSVFYLHMTGIVHKNLRPENVLILDEDDSFHETDIFYKMGSPYLIGFEESRSETQQKLSNRIDQDVGWTYDLYRFENREQASQADRGQGVQKLAEYKPLHDIYSLGIMLMEIGFWRPLAKWTPVEMSVMQSLAASSEQLQATTGPRQNDAEQQLWKYEQVQFYGNKSVYSGRARERRRCYIDTVHATMPSKMGTRYTRVVKMCLRCLSNLSAETTESDKRERILAEEILVELQNISL